VKQYIDEKLPPGYQVSKAAVDAITRNMALATLVFSRHVEHTAQSSNISYFVDITEFVVCDMKVGN
jgi:hypothetical protein